MAANWADRANTRMKQTFGRIPVTNSANRATADSALGPLGIWCLACGEKYYLKQGCRTHGPRAAPGLSDDLIWPAKQFCLKVAKC